MKLATWNVNSLRVRLPHVLNWLEAHVPDILCLQETKIIDGDFPADALMRAGYHSFFAGQKTYNGVAILSRTPGRVISKQLPGGEDDVQQRFIAGEFSFLGAPVCVISAYIPNGGEVDSDKYRYKLSWLQRLHHYLRATLPQYRYLAVAGDYNVAPRDIDVHNPKAWVGSVLVSPAERAAFDTLVDAGMIDVFRFKYPDVAAYTWWDYRAASFQRNDGLRIDHILCSTALADRCVNATVDVAPRALERPSDHVPLMAEFS